MSNQPEPQSVPKPISDKRSYLWAVAIPNIQFVSILLILAQTLVLIYWMIWPYNTIQIQKLEVLNSKVYTGDRLVLELHYCKPAQGHSIDELTADVQYSFHDDVAYNLLGQSVSWLPTGCGVSSEIIPVPMLPPGKYQVEMTRSYFVNPIRRVVVRILSNTFTVTEPCCRVKSEAQ